MTTLTATILLAAYADELINLSALGVTDSKAEDKAFDLAASSGAYLPYINLMTSNSEECKAGEFPINHFAMHGSAPKPDDLGKEVDMLVIAWRAKASEFGDTVISVYDAEDPEFKRIQTKSATANSKCMYGVEFLVYIPKREKFATVFFGSKSARKEAPGVRSYMGRACTLVPKKCETKEFTWFVATAQQCNTPFDIPTNDELIEQITKFKNPPKSQIQKAPEETGGRDR